MANKEKVWRVVLRKGNKAVYSDTDYNYFLHCVWDGKFIAIKCVLYINLANTILVYWRDAAILSSLLFSIRGGTNDRYFVFLFSCLFIIYFVYYFLLLDTSVWTIEDGSIYTANGFFRLIYYFAAMEMGKYFRVHIDKPRKNIVLYILYVIVGVGTLYLIKYLMNKDARLMHFQCLNQFSVLLAVAGLFLLGLSIEQYLADKSLKFYSLCKQIGALTLYLYVVQFSCIRFCEQFPFPLNCVVAVSLIAITAALLQKITLILLRIGSRWCTNVLRKEK